MRACDAAMEVLRETGNPCVQWGDLGLLHMIAERSGWPSEGYRTTMRVLRALSKTPGSLAKGKVQIGNREHLIFRLPKSPGPQMMTL